MTAGGFLTHCRPSVNTSSTTEIAALLVTLGCPAEKSSEMAGMLDRRARQLAEQKGKPYAEALAHLIGLMKQGWSARERGH